MTASLSIAARVRWLLLILILGVGVDQLSKVAALEWLVPGERHSCCADTARLQLAYNDGAFLSLGGDLPKHTRDALFQGGVGVVLLGMLVYLLRANTLDRQTVIGFSLFLAGGGSNLIDRVRFDGAVLDFLNVGIGSLRTGIFNVADMYIMAAAGYLLFIEVRANRNAKRQDESSEADEM